MGFITAYSCRRWTLSLLPTAVGDRLLLPTAVGDSDCYCQQLQETQTLLLLPTVIGDTDFLLLPTAVGDTDHVTAYIYRRH